MAYLLSEVPNFSTLKIFAMHFTTFFLKFQYNFPVNGTVIVECWFYPDSPGFKFACTTFLICCQATQTSEIFFLSPVLFGVSQSVLETVVVIICTIYLNVIKFSILHKECINVFLLVEKNSVIIFINVINIFVFVTQSHFVFYEAET